MNTTPLAQDLWEGIGGHFDSFSQVICEFVDNSIANFEGKNAPNKTINISIAEDTQKIKVIIEDTGTGIDNFEAVLKLGDKSARQSPLNEHGFGLKHALASADHDNNSWVIYSRTKEDFKNQKFKKVTHPYSFDIDIEDIKIADETWPGIFNGSGTIIIFECTKSLFYTVRKGIPGRPAFQTCLDYLREELGYIYAGVIEKGKVSITVQSKDYNKPIEAVKPRWLGFYKPVPGSTKVNLGGGELLIEFQFGEMGESDYVRHYKRNMSTSGVEIRVNGRVLMSNLFKEIWGIEEHPSYNHFLVIINLVTQDLNALPKTRTSKNGIRSGDEKLVKLYEWIRTTHPAPQKDLSGAISERELVKELADLKEKHTRNPAKHIETEFKVFTRVGSPLPVDLYVYDGTDIVLYEAKKDNADVQSIYQLLMYWDGAVSDGIKPTEGILIASTFSTGVDIVLSVINSMKDQNGNNYNFIKKTWKDEKIIYPKP